MSEIKSNPVNNWTMNFGKFRGEIFQDLPLGYCKWLVEKEIYLKPAKLDHYNEINKTIHNYLIERINDNNNDI